MINTATAKTTPADNDIFIIADSASSNATKKTTWANIKTAISGLYVGLTGNQTIAGTKTFSTSPIAPTATAGDNSTKVATTAFCTSQDLGVGQTWQNVTASRVTGTTYTNTTGKAIQCVFSFSSANTIQIGITVDGTTISRSTNTSGTLEHSISVIVPNGSNYIYTTGGSVVKMFELR